jgi:hypothetical protein
MLSCIVLRRPNAPHGMTGLSTRSASRPSPSRSAVFAHMMTFNAHRRSMALDALRQFGVQTEGFGDSMEC